MGRWRQAQRYGSTRAAVPVLASPTAVVLTGVVGDDLILNWAYGANPTFFDVELYDRPPAGSFSLIDSGAVGGTGRSWDPGDLAVLLHSYYCRVRARSGAVTSPWVTSNQLNF